MCYSCIKQYKIWLLFQYSNDQYKLSWWQLYFVTSKYLVNKFKTIGFYKLCNILQLQILVNTLKTK